jgi:hypothetical protein
VTPKRVNIPDKPADLSAISAQPVWDSTVVPIKAAPPVFIKSLLFMENFYHGIALDGI